MNTCKYKSANGYTMMINKKIELCFQKLLPWYVKNNFNIWIDKKS